MTQFKRKYRVESARLRGWDYTSAGWYFATICTKGQICLLGNVTDGEMHLSEIGEIVVDEWLRTAQLRRNVELDEWVVMPNHIHGIIVIRDSPTFPRARETPRQGVSTSEGTSSALKRDSLGSIIGQFKSACTKRIWARGFHDFAWQPRFYDHIVRSEESLNQIRQYILENPAKWEIDREQITNLWM